MMIPKITLHGRHRNAATGPFAEDAIDGAGLGQVRDRQVAAPWSVDVTDRDQVPASGITAGPTRMAISVPAPLGDRARLAGHGIAARAVSEDSRRRFLHHA